MSSFIIHWICQQPTPYNDFLFSSLVSDSEIDLTVHFINPIRTSHPWQSSMAKGFTSRFYKRIFGLDWHLLSLALSNHKSFFVIGGWNEPTINSVINLLILNKRPFAIWTDTPNLTKQRNMLKRLIRQTWLKWLFQHATYMMSTGKPGIEALTKMGCSKEKVVNFPFFVDLDAYQKSYQQSNMLDNSNPIKFVSSGRLLNATKGHSIALQSFALINNNIKLNSFTYEIAGTGPDYEMLRREAQRLHLTEYVRFLGWLEPSQLCQVYANSDVLIHPSYIDPFPVTVLEAMATGLPVLGSDICGSVQDRIQHGINGFIHQAGNVDELANHIMQCINKPEKIRIMGAAARQTAEQWPVSRGVATIKGMVESCLCV